MGRRSTYSLSLVEKIAASLSTGEPLAQICRKAGMPGVQTVSDWSAKYPEVAVIIARAREIGFDAIAAQALAIADEVENDTIHTENGDKMDAEWVARSRLRVETRLKLLAKWCPKRYGEQVTVEHGVTEGTAASLGAWLKSHMPAQIVRPAPPMIEDEPSSD